MILNDSILNLWFLIHTVFFHDSRLQGYDRLTDLTVLGELWSHNQCPACAPLWGPCRRASNSWCRLAQDEMWKTAEQKHHFFEYIRLIYLILAYLHILATYFSHWLIHIYLYIIEYTLYHIHREKRRQVPVTWVDPGAPRCGGPWIFFLGEFFYSNGENMGRFDLKNDFLQSEEMYFCGPCGPCLDKRGWICEKASALMSIVDYTFYCLFQNLKTRKPYFAARGEISLVSQGKESITHGCYQAWSRAQLNQLLCQMAPCSEDSICICHFHRAILRWTLGTLHIPPSSRAQEIFSP